MRMSIDGLGRGHEPTVRDVVDAGRDEVGEDLVLVARADETSDGHADLARVVAAQDVAEVAGGHAHVHRLAGANAAGGDHVGVRAHVVDDLGHQAAPVDGVRAGEASPEALVQLGAELLVAEGLLHRVLAVVEVAAHAEHGDVLAELGDHLLALDVADALGGVEDDDLGESAVGEAFERGLAGVAAGRDEDQVVVLGPSAGAKLGDRLREEQRHALQRDVLERARGPVPQLEHVHLRRDLDHRRDPLVVPLLAVRLLHERIDALAADVDPEAVEDRRGAAPVRHLGEGDDLGQGELTGASRERTARRRARCPR